MYLGMLWALSSLGLGAALAASHSDAPLIKQDPQANITDVYAFVGTKYNDPGQEMLNVVVHVRPFSEPGDGVIYDRFADDALYSIHLTNPSSGATVTRYDFRFSDVNPLATPGLKNPNTILSYGLGTEAGPILSIGDARQNYTQTYSVTRTSGGSTGTLATGLQVAPPNVGVRTTPVYNDSLTGKAISGATSFAELDAYTQQAIQQAASGEVTFAGPREDGFYADTPAIFDLLDGRILGSDGFGQSGGGVDGFKGFNVLAYGLQIPMDDVQASFPTRVGVYASVSRPRLRLLTTGGDPVSAGPFVQVNRMGNPLFNEVLVALADKDKYNRTSPTEDAANFAQYALNPELATLLNLVFGTSFPDTGRSDLLSIFIPDVLRVNTTTGPVPLAGQTGFNRLSVFGGDVTGGVPSGFPNGRRFGDDVVDIALTAVALGTVLGDNVNANDQLYHQVFPYSGTPHAGPSVAQRQPPP
jgi:hypothetical protein